MRTRTFLLALLVCFLVWPVSAMARVSGSCSDCHTMHNSEGGTAADVNGPNRALTRGDCVGCHTGNNSGSNNIPYVLDTSGKELAGGNFYYVTQDSHKGHDVVGISNTGVITPPGWTNGDTAYSDAWGNTPANNGSWDHQLTCAGVYGCHGDHSQVDQYRAIKGAHHTDDYMLKPNTYDINKMGNTVGTSYRFLAGIYGIEAKDWEYAPTSESHNQYYAYDRVDKGSLDDPATADKHSINWLCAECHGYFHSGSGSNGIDDSDVTYDSGVAGTVGEPWIRHPVDYDLNNFGANSPYRQYPGGNTTAGTYDPLVPVGSDLSNGVQSTVFQKDNDAIVLCISCHRAHGSPYKAALRWDYGNNCSAHSGASPDQCGCLACHTDK